MPKRDKDLFLLFHLLEIVTKVVLCCCVSLLICVKLGSDKISSFILRFTLVINSDLFYFEHCAVAMVVFIHF